MRLIRRLAGPTFVHAGALHFAKPRTYLKIMPPSAPEVMVYASGWPRSPEERV